MDNHRILHNRSYLSTLYMRLSKIKRVNLEIKFRVNDNICNFVVLTCANEGVIGIYLFIYYEQKY